MEKHIIVEDFTLNDIANIDDLDLVQVTTTKDNVKGETIIKKLTKCEPENE